MRWEGGDLAWHQGVLAQGRHSPGKCSLVSRPRAVPVLRSGRKGCGRRSKVPLTWGMEHDEDRGVFLHKLVKVFIGQVINGAALICPGSLGGLGLWRLWTGRPKTGRAQSKPGAWAALPKSSPLAIAPTVTETTQGRSRGPGVWPCPPRCPAEPQTCSAKCLLTNSGFQLELPRQLKKSPFFPGIWGFESVSSAFKL